ncbi:MAG TPA: hydantoinase/oxoprolinase family protein [Candidatus Baltobacteraceae bacterium]|nr:hydantoinase/oxoprolinase family protein [Candidatus Baltobacteraceae bacterium]
MNAQRKLRIGIDVGGTFTDVIAIDVTTRELVASVKVPTTHRASEGVAAGIVDGIRRLLERADVRPGDVAFIAHSTTQATNALLEGDVARVGVVGLLGKSAWLARRQIRFAPVELAPGRSLAPAFAFASARDEASMRSAVDRAIAEGAEAIVASAPFGVDRPAGESGVVEYARTRGVDATSGHDVSAMYGLRARTRTAALNAAILPRMIRTSRMTASAVKNASIPAPLMIMRSDGGVMDVREIERRPILTLLSGPAAGVAGALLYENLTDGIFIEVGGTSSDISAIRQGRPQMRPARIGGHRTMLHTVDVRTLGIAGGSMIRIGANSVVDAGPRSAHIAGCAYACFCDEAQLDGAVVETIAPWPDDPNDYAILRARDGTAIALTTSCAANALGCVPEGAFANGNRATASSAYALLAQRLGSSGDALARAVLDIATAKLRATIDELIADYGLERAHVTIVGGGGGAGAIVPYAADAMGLRSRIARDAEVIAPVGVALALVRDVVERTVVAPTPDDIARLRREAIDRVVAAGASPDRVEVAIEIDSQRNRIRASASGATALAEPVAAKACDEAGQRAAAAQSLNGDGAALERVDLTAELIGYRSGDGMAVVDGRGVVRLLLRGARVLQTPASETERAASRAIERDTRFGDVGRALPALYLLRGERIATYDGLAAASQAVALALEELEGCDPAEVVALLTVPRRA